MRRGLTGVLVGLILVTSLIGCASTTEGKLYQSGSVSKSVAESSYQAIYAAYKAGQVSETDMDRARMAYDQWAVAQASYVQAASSGALTSGLVQAVQAALQILMGIAAQYALL